MEQPEPDSSQAGGQTPAAIWTVQGQSVVKPGNDRFTIAGTEVWRANEDRFHINQKPDRLLAAVADGAGASGLFCGAWAETLVSRLPDDPLQTLTALDSWMAGFCLDFGRNQAAATAGRQHSKLVREGSCSTLTACWLKTTDFGCHLHWLGYGDSPLLLLDRTDGAPDRLLEWHPRPLRLLQRDPHLLNWKDVPTDAGFRSGTLNLERRTCMILATDAVGLYLLSCYHAQNARLTGSSSAHQSFLHEFEEMQDRKGGRRDLVGQPSGFFSSEIQSLRQALLTETSFAIWLTDRYQKGLIANDDATVIIIDVEFPEPEMLQTPLLTSEASP
ncbi:MAG TPA: hypothetical protein HPP80_07895 [Rhodospirillaceae bacterium]|nr:hypothetical protein [Rhodospirillaceae bacterium]